MVFRRRTTTEGGNRARPVLRAKRSLKLDEVVPPMVRKEGRAGRSSSGEGLSSDWPRAL